MKNKNILILTNIILLIYLIITMILLWNHKGFLMDWEVHPTIIFIVMFIFEILSTITFQLRIWLTQNNKIKLAALVGASSWLIAGFQGILLVNGSISGISEICTFLLKIPPVFIATFNGILINSYFRKGDKK